MNRSVLIPMMNKNRFGPIPFILLVGVLFFGCIYFFSKDSNPKQNVITKHEKQENLYGPHYSLWKDEAKSKSLNPESIDKVIKLNDKTNHYENHLKGYNLNYPSTWEIDHHQATHYTRLFSKNLRVDITVQNVEDISLSTQAYIYHTLNTIKPYITVDKTFNVSNFQVRNVDYKRPALKGIHNDLNHYSYYFVTQGKYVYTFQLKTNEKLHKAAKQKMVTLLDSFKTAQPTSIELNTKVKNKNSNPEVNLNHNNKSLVIPKNHFLMGIYTPTSLDINEIDAFTGNHVGSQMFYKPINSEYDAYVEQLVQENRLPVVTFLLERANSEHNEDVVTSMIEGEFDKTMESWISGIKQTQSPVFIRIGNEMNGNWSDWSHKNNFNDPDLYKLAYRHIVSIFKENQVDNAYFIWNPNNVSAPLFEWNHATMYYPGDTYVDFIGMTSYNFGPSAGNHYKSFDEMYEELYWDYSRSYASKPLMIGEFGAVEAGDNKSKWILDMFNHIPTKYPNIKAAIWFDETHGKFDLRIHSSMESANAFKQGMNKPEVITSLK